jgi:PAT family beta-lactamase induction signal transducer AmpG
MVATLMAPEPELKVKPPRNLRDAVVEPFKEFFSREGALSLLLLIVLYKLGDAFAGALSTTFLIRGAGFSLSEIGYINKIFGLASTIAGALLGGSMMAKLGLYRALMLFGILQAVSNLGYWVLAVNSSELWLMAVVVGLENLCGGLGTVASVALLMALCNRQFSATQFALLSALAAVGRTYLAGPLTPFLVEGLGWPTFFLVTIVIALPGLFLLRWRKQQILALDRTE